MSLQVERVLWERAEARVLALNYKTKPLLERQLMAAERSYGRGSGERIRALMREVWTQEMLK